MNPGLPGLGIAGLFYILTALAMPVSALLRWLRRERGKPARWMLAVRQFAIAAGITAAMAATFWLLEAALGAQVRTILVVKLQAIEAAQLRVPVALTSAAVLVAVLGAMQVVRVLLQKRQTANVALPAQR